jgi:hypothetical protein
VLLLSLAGCAGSAPPEPQRAARPVDMRGHWELDYARSDNLQARFSGLVRQLQQVEQRRAAAAERGRSLPAVSGGSREALLGLAQMAELITGAQLLEVEQNRVSIRVAREGNFALNCDFGTTGIARQDYGIGRETCFWEGEQLVFSIELPDGLDILHRISLAADGNSLAIDTILRSSAVSSPFALRRVYRRYEPGQAGYRCTETLTRGRVCTTESR